MEIIDRSRFPGTRPSYLSSFVMHGPRTNLVKKGGSFATKARGAGTSSTRFSAAFPPVGLTNCGMWIATQYSSLKAPDDDGGGTMKNVTRMLLGLVLLLIATNGTPSTTWAAPAQVQDTSRHLYDRVMQEFKQRDYEAALAGFRLFLELHGQTSLAANAHYWVGECQFRMGRYREALKSFYNVVSNYPLSPKLAASTLKLGQTYTRLKDSEKARMMYERVVDQYPDSPEAELAKKAIDVESARTEPSPELSLEPSFQAPPTPLTE